ncbi:DNA replication and repair protein RecF [Candidatus Daviesbacteria bacterium]|nr:DNA replication and repair protein RecF [Candidatus Daviesbacteria bacterium]
MFLKSLKLVNFRNYSSCNFEFKTPLIILLGNNAQGKSNFLESIYFLSTTKSHKAEKDEELIKKAENFLRVEGQVQNEENNDQTQLEIAMQIVDGNLVKKVKVNGVTRRIVDYIGNLSVVTFSPEDINLVTGSPSLRRWHIDLTLAQIDKEYKKALTEYGEIIIRKNRLLKAIREGIAKIEELNFWVNEQVRLGEIISTKRFKFFNFLNSVEKKFDSFFFEYLQNELSLKRILEYQVREIASATSLIGPHRDDFRFLTGKDKRDLAHFGSRGEHRTAILDLKLSEVSFVESTIGSRPILLLDDVFSELDDTHQEHVLGLVSLQQTIIASVELDPHLKLKLKDASFFFVENGQLNEIVDK